jgi:uncharacterized protein (TIGR02246 family)
MAAAANPGSDLAARLAALEDRQAISDLMLAFGAALDAKDWDAYAELFLEDGKFTIEGQARHGREEIVAGPRRDLDRYGALQHFSTNHKVALTGDEADSSHYLIAIHVPDTGAAELHADAGGRYDCKCVRTEAGWRFAEVELTVLWRAGESFVVQPKD